MCWKQLRLQDIILSFSVVVVPILIQGKLQLRNFSSVWSELGVGVSRFSYSMINCLWRSPAHARLLPGIMTTATGNWRAIKSSRCGWRWTMFQNPPVSSMSEDRTSGSFFTSRFLNTFYWEIVVLFVGVVPIVAFMRRSRCLIYGCSTDACWLHSELGFPPSQVMSSVTRSLPLYLIFQISKVNATRYALDLRCSVKYPLHLLPTMHCWVAPIRSCTIKKLV